MKEKFGGVGLNPEPIRDKLEKFRGLLNNKIKILLAARGILFRKTDLLSDKDLNAVLAAPVSELEHMELEILVGEIRHLNQTIIDIGNVFND